MAVKRLLISVILALGAHAILLGSDCAWLKQIPCAAPGPVAMTIALTLQQTPVPPKTPEQNKQYIPLKKPVRIKIPSQKPKIVQKPVPAVQKEMAKTINPPISPVESQLTRPQESSESTASESENIPPSANVIQKIRPFYLNHPAPLYPRIARIKGYQGNVILGVLVDRDGKVGDLRVLSSSGYPILDKAAKNAVRNWSFAPGMIGKDKVAMWVRIPVRFELK